MLKLPSQISCSSDLPNLSWEVVKQEACQRLIHECCGFSHFRLFWSAGFPAGAESADGEVPGFRQEGARKASYLRWEMARRLQFHVLKWRKLK